MNRALHKAGYEERSFEVGGVTLNYAEGPANGPPVVLFPGQTQPWQSYTRVLPALAKRFRVLACDVHGHGRSSFAPHRYTFQRIGEDFAVFLERVVGRPAIVSGNSSGGVIAVWLAANAPEWVRGVMPEDPPLLSCEWPRIKECFVYRLLNLSVETLADPETRDVATFFDRFEIPVEGGVAVSAAAGPLLKVLSSSIRLAQRLRPGQRTVDLPLTPFVLRMLVRGFSEYDPEFSRPFLDGSFGEGFDHAEALSRITCPMLLLHASWFESERYGLVGAMTDQEAARVCSLVPDCRYERIPSGHIVHQENPRAFVRYLVGLEEELGES